MQEKKSSELTPSLSHLLRLPKFNKAILYIATVTAGLIDIVYLKGDHADIGENSTCNYDDALSPEERANQKLQEIFREILEQQEISPENPSPPSPASSPPAKPIIIPKEEGDLGLA